MSKHSITAKQIVFSGVALALATVISTVIKLPSLPNGGSITLFSMLIVCLIGYWYGPKVGIVASIAYGILQFIVGPYVVHPAQVLLDYPLAPWDYPDFSTNPNTACSRAISSACSAVSSFMRFPASFSIPNMLEPSAEMWPLCGLPPCTI